MIPPARMHSVRNLSNNYANQCFCLKKTNAIVFWQSDGARYVRAMCLFLIPDISNKHVDITNIHISILGK